MQRYILATIGAIAAIVVGIAIRAILEGARINAIIADVAKTATLF